MKISFLRFILPLATLAFVAPLSDAAEKNSGAASSGPTVIPGGTVSTTYVISKAGSYVLGGDRLMSDLSKTIIEIAAPDVTLDLSGFSLGFPGGNATSGCGVTIPAVENVEVRNGTISGAIVGIYADFGKGFRALDVRVNGGTLGILSNATDSLIDRCSVADSSNTGLHLTADGTRVTDTVVSGAGLGIYAGRSIQLSRVTVSGGGTGIYLGDYSSLRDSRISNVHGTALHASYHCLVQNNHLVENFGRSVTLSSSAVFSGNFVGSTALWNGERVGIQCEGTVNVLSDNRIMTNGTNLVGTYINGGGNILVP